MTTIYDYSGLWVWDRADIVPPEYQNAGVNYWNIYYATGVETKLGDITNILVEEIPYPTLRYDAHFSVADVTYSVKATWEDEYGESDGLLVFYCRRNTETPTETLTPVPSATPTPTWTPIPEYSKINFMFHSMVYRPWAHRTPIQ